MDRPNLPMTEVGLPLDTEYADGVDFNDEDEDNLRALLPLATVVLKDNLHDLNYLRYTAQDRSQWRRLQQSCS